MIRRDDAPAWAADRLTTAQVADLTGRDPRAVPAWAAHHRIRHDDTYPATLTRWAAAQDRRMAHTVDVRHRLARFIRNPLNHTGGH